MNTTMFPAKAIEVAGLTAQEFEFSLEWSNAPSLDEICRRFAGDANRALVWVIRFRALEAWCARDGMRQWRNADSRTAICEVAASFELNDRWEFEPDAFCLAVDAAVRQRLRLERS
jgi:hypothetical protein